MDRIRTAGHGFKVTRVGSWALRGRRSAFALALAAGALAVFPARADAPRFDRPIEAMLSGVVEGYIRPGYAALADAANALQAATVRYCANPSDTTRDAVGESFQRTVQSLGAVAFLDFGPAGVNRRLERLKTPVPEKGATERAPSPRRSPARTDPSPGPKTSARSRRNRRRSRACRRSSDCCLPLLPSRAATASPNRAASPGSSRQT